MVKIDLVTGFLGSGKTTFIRKYAKHLIDEGQNIGILENDYGAVNVDMMLLQDLMGEHCELEMVSGGCDMDCHRRRFRTKLIAMGMSGYDRVIVEPSGIYDVDEFFDALHEEPLDSWYEIGNVIAVVDAGLPQNLSAQSDYLLASEAADAGIIFFSRMDETPPEKAKEALIHINRALAQISCRRVITEEETIAIKWEDIKAEDWKKIRSCGYRVSSWQKMDVEGDESFCSMPFMNVKLTKQALKEAALEIFADQECGKVHRIKGFIRTDQGGWEELNATERKAEFKPIAKGQEIIIVIGEKLNQEKISSVIERLSTAKTAGI